MEKFKIYIWNIYISGDRFLNTLLGGSPQYTLSGHMGSKIEGKTCLWCGLICKVLNLFQENHCERAYQHEVQRYGPPDDAAF